MSWKWLKMSPTPGVVEVETAAAQPGVPEAVVGRALVGVRQDVYASVASLNLLSASGLPGCDRGGASAPLGGTPCECRRRWPHARLQEPRNSRAFHSCCKLIDDADVAGDAENRGS
jgi:hypothetical protein